jgi:alpha-1,6-mannosyltransferase
MIICDVTQCYSPFGGGVRRYLTEKRRFVGRETDDEHVLVVPGVRDGYERDGCLHTYTIKSPPISATSRYRALLNQQALRALLQQIQPDIIESGDPYQVAWTALREAQAQGIPIVGFYHSHFPEAYLRTAGKFGGPLFRRAVLYWSRKYVRRLYNNFDNTLVCAQGIRDVLREWGVNNVRPIKLGVDVEAFQPGAADPSIRARFGIPESAFFLLYVGRLAGEKNVRTLFDAFERLRRTSRRDYRLVCVGQGPWREQLLQTRLAVGGNLVHWLPHLGDSRALAALYRSADLEVHPSINETFGLVPLEAQACGLAVCGIRGSCLDENILAGLDLWATQNTGRDLAAAVERMAAADRAEIGARASAQVRARYAWPVALRELWNCYEELVRRKPRVGGSRAPRRSHGDVAHRERTAIIRKYQARDRAAIRQICCETGFLGQPIDPVFEDREVFADFLTSYYTDEEPESLFVIEIDGSVSGYLSGCRRPWRRQWQLATLMPAAFLRVARRYLLRHYKPATRRYLEWLVSRGHWETPPRPPGTPHFHVNLLPHARGLAGTKALVDAFLAYLQAQGDRAVYGQMVVYEERRTDSLFSRFGFNVLTRREITKFRDHYAGRVFLCTAWKDLSTRSRLHGARLPFLRESSA